MPEGPVYTLTECIEAGLQQAAAARNALRDEEIAGRLIGQVRAQLLPSVKAHGGYTRLDEVPSYESDGEIVLTGREDNYSAGVEASQLLYSGGSVGAALKAAKLYRQIAQVRVRRTENELVRDIRTGFNDILLADEQVKVQEASLAQLEDLLKQAESRQRQETASEFDVLTARVKVANERPLLIAARKRADLARAAFRSLVHLDAEEFVLAGELVFKPSEMTLEDWQEQGLERRPELQELRDFLGMRQADIRAEQGGYLPQIRAFANYAGANPQSGSARDEWEWGWTAGVTAEWDLFDGALRRNRIAEKRLELEKARETLADTERQVRLEIQSHYLDLTQAAETVSASAE
ncbi:MAG: TolC family protein, partial [Lentisphaerae bacterium]|nr:TolC family protein [Lentisphaerota bacterium]